MISRFQRIATCAATGVLCLLVTIGSARAADYKVLYAFCSQSCSEGSFPQGGLITDSQGDLFGGAQFGNEGTKYCTVASGCGVLFKLAPDGTYTVLYDACSQQGCADGGVPIGSLVADGSGNLYGAMSLGGVSKYCPTNVVPGCGVIFKLAPDGTYTVLHTFCSQANCTDGAAPNGSLLLDAQGNLYGTTDLGGTGSCYSGAGCGTVFKLSPSGAETVLYTFCSHSACTDGAEPSAGLLMDRKGVLYGTTSSGGAAGWGVVFKLKPSGKEVVLYNFCSQSNCSDGAEPVAGLIMDKRDDLFGTTFFGGNQCGYVDGCGVAFELEPTGKEVVLYSFCAQSNCSDGALPYAGLLRDKKGNLLGTTSVGGTGSGGEGYCEGCGIVFELTPGGKETVLYNFCIQNYCEDGMLPMSPLVKTKNNTFVGTTSEGTPGGVIFSLHE